MSFLKFSIIQVIFVPLLLLASILINLIRPFKEIRLYHIVCESYGALALHGDYPLRLKQLRDRSNSSFIGFATGTVANKALLKIVSRIAPIIKLNDPLATAVFRKIMQYNSWFVSRHFLIIRNYYKEFDIGEASLYFTDKEADTCKQQLAGMGIKKDDWYVCVHAREPAYFDNVRSDWNANYHDYRDSKIENCFEAGDYIAEKGGYFVRMGSVVGAPLPGTLNPKIIDYATLYRDELTDIYLSANCHFFLGNSSGTETIPRIFDVPTAIANLIPLSLLPYTRKDLYIPKLIWNESEERYLRFDELHDLGFFTDWGYCTEHYQEKKLKVIENSPEDILCLCKEMFDKINGIKTGYEEPQKRFKERYLSHKPGYEYSGDMAGFFLEKYKDLL